MPYAYPADPSSSTASASTSTAPRPGHRRTRSSFSDERGSGTFTSLGSLPRRRPSSDSSKRALFHLSVDDDSPPDDDHSPSSSPPARPSALSLPTNSLRLSMESGRFSPSVNPPTHIELPKTTLTPASPPSTSPSPGSTVPFPTSSPLSPTHESPFIPDTPPPLQRSLSSSGSSLSLPRTPSTPIILSNGKPLKPSLKSCSSSPNVVADFANPVRKHSRAQSAPSTPRVHFAEKDAGLETVRVFNRSGKPASLSKPAGEETETETEAEYPFPSVLSSFGGAGALGSLAASGAASPSQLLHEVDPTPGVTSAIPRPAPPARANVLLETVTLPRTRPPTLRGTVLVRNIHFEKNVVVRFTLDEWQTTSEVSCRHVVSLPGLPPPFPGARTVGDVAGQIAEGGDDAWDRFSFTIRLEDYEPKLSERTLWIVVRYQACHGALGEFWDNNGGQNYRVGFRRVAAPASSPLATPMAVPRAVPLAASASFPAPRRHAGFEKHTGFERHAGFVIPQVSTFGAPKWAGAHVTAQQRTFSAPSSLKYTPVTGARAVAPAVVSRVAVRSVGFGGADADASEPEPEEPETAQAGRGEETVVVVEVPVPVVVAPPAEGEEERAGEVGGGGGGGAPGRVPLLRRHTAPQHAPSPVGTPRFPVPPPIAVPHHHRSPVHQQQHQQHQHQHQQHQQQHQQHQQQQHGSGHQREGAQHEKEGAAASPVERYISRRLSLSNYVAPGAKAVVHVVEESRAAGEKKAEEGDANEKGEEKEKKDGEKKATGIVTPPTTPPREAQLKSLPPPSAEEKEDAAAMLSPLVMDHPGAHPDATPFSPTSTAEAARPWAMRSLEAQLALSQLASPPVSREGSREGSGAASPVVRSGRSSPRPDAFPSSSLSTATSSAADSSSATSPSATSSTAASSAATVAPIDIASDSPGAGPVQVPASSPGGTKVETSDSSYAAFIRQWCFAQSTPPSAGAPSPSAGSSAAPTPVPTPPPPPFASSFGQGGVGLSGGGGGVPARRQGAWPGEHQYGFPGFGFAQGVYPGASREGVVGAPTR